MVVLCQTVYRLTCVHRTFHWTFSKNKLEVFLSLIDVHLNLGESVRYKLLYYYIIVIIITFGF